MPKETEAHVVSEGERQSMHLTFPGREWRRVRHAGGKERDVSLLLLEGEQQSEAPKLVVVVPELTDALELVDSFSLTRIASNSSAAK
jgi:hypothetical protein